MVKETQARIGDEEWFTEYLQEDLLLHVIPGEGAGVEVFTKIYTFFDDLEDSPLLNDKQSFMESLASSNSL